MSSYVPLSSDSAALVVVDIQTTLMKAIHNREQVNRNAGLLLRLSRIEEIPRLVTTQYVKGLGPIEPEIQELLGEDPEIHDKTEFSCLGNEAARSALEGLGRQRLVVTGVEAHICVYQTVAAALAEGYDVTVAADGVGSRTEANHELGLARMRELGANVGPTEMVLYELLGKAGTPAFKALLPHLK